MRNSHGIQERKNPVLGTLMKPAYAKFGVLAHLALVPVTQPFHLRLVNPVDSIWQLWTGRWVFPDIPVYHRVALSGVVRSVHARTDTG